MKRKLDFVTNSSSSSYIVCIPDIDQFLIELESEIKLSDDFRDKFFESGTDIYFGQYDEEIWQEFGKVHAIVDKLGYVIAYDEMGPENSPRYINIASDEKYIEKIKKILNAPKIPKPKYNKGLQFNFLKHLVEITGVIHINNMYYYTFECTKKCCASENLSMKLTEEDLTNLFSWENKGKK